MPAHAGIQIRFGYKFKSRLDSGLRRNDGNRADLQLTRSERIRGLELSIIQSLLTR